MRILFLGPDRPELEEYLASLGDEIVRAEKRLTPSSAKLRGIDSLVSYGYRHIIRPEVLDLCPGRAINLHISYLPFNRGTDPNLWSFLEDSPKGVTIHQIDQALDTGDILAQEQVVMEPHDTLSSSYNRLSAAMLNLFRLVWPDIRAGRLVGWKQPDGGSAHYAKDKVAYEHLLVSGWDTRVAGLIGKAIPRNKSIDREESKHGN